MLGASTAPLSILITPRFLDSSFIALCAWVPANKGGGLPLFVGLRRRFHFTGIKIRGGGASSVFLIINQSPGRVDKRILYSTHSNFYTVFNRQHQQSNAMSPSPSDLVAAVVFTECVRVEEQGQRLWFINISSTWQSRIFCGLRGPYFYANSLLRFVKDERRPSIIFRGKKRKHLHIVPVMALQQHFNRLLPHSAENAFAFNRCRLLSLISVEGVGRVIMECSWLDKSSKCALLCSIMKTLKPFVDVGLYSSWKDYLYSSNRSSTL